MATNSLDSLGRALGSRNKTIKASTNRFSADFPQVESSSDIISPLMPFKFEYYTYTDSPSVYLNLTILEKFKVRIT